MEFNNYSDLKINQAYPKILFSTFEKPKFYDYIPESYKINWPDPQKFLPDSMMSHFNKRVFINFIHRECFNSCVADNAQLSSQETQCYQNCKNKHLSSLETFKNIMMERRRWKGWKNFISVKEYSRTPEEIGTNFPTDLIRRHQIYDNKEEQFLSENTMGLREALNSEFVDANKKTKTIFDVYGDAPLNSKVGQEKLAEQRKDVYNEYVEMNEKYGPRVAEMLKGNVNMQDWKDVPGDDWKPEEE